MGYRLGVYEKSMPDRLALEDKLAQAKRAGFDYMELSVDETDGKLARLDWGTGETEKLREGMARTGVPIHSVCLSAHRRYPMGHPDAAVRQRSMEILKKAVLLAYALGVRVIQLAGYDVYYVPGTERTRAFFEENLREAVRFAASYGVILGFETMETPFMDTVEKAMRYVDPIASPYLAVYPDVGNLTNASLLYRRSVEDDMETGRGHICAVHLKETRPGVYREVPFGTGHVDFASAVRKAAELGVRAFVGEFWYTGSDEWERDMREANAFLRARLDACLS